MTGTVFAVDANVIVAMVSDWHDHHERALAEVQRRLERSEVLLTPAAALIEAYSVLTRLPAPHRADPHIAWNALETGFIEGVDVVSLTSAEAMELLSRLAKESIGGGRTYDAIIGECARKGGASVLLTFNVRHFEPPPAGVAIVEP